MAKRSNFKAGEDDVGVILSAALEGGFSTELMTGGWQYESDDLRDPKSKINSKTKFQNQNYKINVASESSTLTFCVVSSFVIVRYG